MHPNRKFHSEDEAAIAALVRKIGFGTLIAQTAEGLRAVHLPLLLQGDRLRFHVSRGNLVHAALLAGGEALVVVNGPDAYVSPDWYGLPDRVPTWSYVAVEINGPVAPLGEAALIAMLDEMSFEHEQRLAPKPAWTRDKMDPARFDGLVKAITGFEMTIHAWRGTAKLDQDKPAEVRERLAAALSAQGWSEIAALVRSGLEAPAPQPALGQ